MQGVLFLLLGPELSLVPFCFELSHCDDIVLTVILNLGVVWVAESLGPPLTGVAVARLKEAVSDFH